MERRGCHSGKYPVVGIRVRKHILAGAVLMAALFVIPCGGASARPAFPFAVFASGSDDFTVFGEMAAAMVYAKQFTPSFIYDRNSGRLLWDNKMPVPPAVKMKIPALLQMPELPRGCEVTSLAMLLNSQGIQADKLNLAEQIKKDPAPYQVKNGKIYYGNPNKGFVGQMDSCSAPGYGVYHGPAADLLNKYMPDMALDLTGCAFEDLFYYITLDIPVWVIINTTYAPLPESAFITWNTDQGPVRITYREHSVLLTGYDETAVYFNDPLTGTAQAGRIAFASAWVQMGRQAVTIMP